MCFMFINMYVSYIRCLFTFCICILFRFAFENTERGRVYHMHLKCRWITTTATTASASTAITAAATKAATIAFNINACVCVAWLCLYMVSSLLLTIWYIQIGFVRAYVRDFSVSLRLRLNLNVSGQSQSDAVKCVHTVRVCEYYDRVIKCIRQARSLWHALRHKHQYETRFQWNLSNPSYNFHV